jgi:predicted alpha/beta superfamily hydrolase
VKTEEELKTERIMALTPAEVPLRTTFFTLEPPRTMRAAGYDWDHEIRVALPVSYGESDRTYPVLWLTDNHLEPALQAVGAADVILVGVGAERVELRESSARRLYDFYPDEDLYPAGPAGDYIRTIPAMQGTRGGGAQRFLDFLVDDVRAALAADYRLADDHCLAGYSAGGTFVAYSLFARPGGFTRFICGSGSLDCVWPLEERYAAEHDDLPAHVFLAAGEGEPTDHLGWNNVSSIARLAELLSIRKYPSLDLTLRIFPGETHKTMLGPLLSWGVRSVWGDELYDA